jgi:DNA-binding MarR family transcriptional regulator
MQELATPFPLLSETARSVIIDLLIHGPLSRADLARRAGMSPATLTRVARSLVDTGLLTVPFSFTEWAKGAAVIALRHQLDLAIRTDA